MTVKRFRKILNRHKNKSVPVSVVCSDNMQVRFLRELNRHPGLTVIMASDYETLELRTAAYYYQQLEDYSLYDDAMTFSDFFDYHNKTK